MRTLSITVIATCFSFGGLYGHAVTFDPNPMNLTFGGRDGTISIVPDEPTACEVSVSAAPFGDLISITSVDPNPATSIMLNVHVLRQPQGQIESVDVTGMWVSNGKPAGCPTGANGSIAVKVTVTRVNPVINSVVNAASFLSGVVPNSWIAIQGTNLSATTDTWEKNIVNGNLPTTLDGVNVSIGGKPAYIYYVSPGQINAVAPDVGTGPLTVTLTSPVGASAPLSVVSQALGPAFFLWANKYAVATRQDFSLAAKNGTFQSVTTPAKPGDVIIFWGTGFGPTTPAAPIGVPIPSDKLYNTMNPVSITIGGIPALVYGAALAPGLAALYQVAVQIPSSAPDGDLAAVAAIGGTQSSSNALITVQH